MRVVHIAQSTAGGIASYFEEIADYQASAFGRKNVTFIVPTGTAHLPRVDSGQVIPFGSASRKPASLLNFARIVRAAVTRLEPDIVHLHSSFAGAVVRSMFAPRRRRPGVIYCPHGWAFAIETSAAKQHGYALIERRLAAITDVIHVNSRSEYDLAVRFALPAEKMRVIPNGIAWTAPPRRAARRGPVRVAFVGRHDRQKGLDILLETIRRVELDTVEFDIVGDGVLSGGVRAADAAPANVRFHGWLSRQQTLELVERVDAVIMPSRWDAAPIVATEAMRAGVPVIGSNRGALPEIVGDGVGGHIFDLDDPESLGRVLKRLDRAELDRLGVTARRRWESLYVSDRMNQLTCRAYEELLNARRSGRDLETPAEVCSRQAQPWT